MNTFVFIRGKGKRRPVILGAALSAIETNNEKMERKMKNDPTVIIPLTAGPSIVGS